MSAEAFAARGRDALPVGPAPPGAAPAGRVVRVAEGQTHHRIFIAVALAPALRDAIAQVQSRLAAVSSGLRWVPPENLHLTLKFLGTVAAPRVAKVTEAAREVAARTRPFAITLAGVGAFPSSRRPRVVWVGVGQGADRLVALAGDLDAELGRRKFPRERRPFQSHLTIARVKHGGSPPDLSAPLAGLRDLGVGNQGVEAVIVMESTLRPSGAIYHAVEEAMLRESG